VQSSLVIISGVQLNVPEIEATRCINVMRAPNLGQSLRQLKEEHIAVTASTRSVRPSNAPKHVLAHLNVDYSTLDVQQLHPLRVTFSVKVRHRQSQNNWMDVGQVISMTWPSGLSQILHAVFMLWPAREC
jgi:hypothetical protein